MEHDGEDRLLALIYWASILVLAIELVIIIFNANR